MDTKVDFDAQYCTSYNTRYARLRSMVLDSPDAAGRGLEVRELKDDLGTECLVVAIFFLKSAAKPSVLKENNEAEKRRIRCYIDDSAAYYIQDLSGDLELVFAPGFCKLPALVTGMVLGFVGRLIDKARFECRDVVFPCALANQKYALAGSAARVLIAGNCLVNRGNIWRLKLLADYCRDKACALVLIGDSFTTGEDMPRTDLLGMWAQDAGVDVFLVPGFNDPTTQMLPQCPLHPLLFGRGVVGRETGTSGGLFPLQNPCQTSIAGADFAVLSHHIMDELAKYVPGTGRGADGVSAAGDEALFMDLLELLVRARHLVPSAPDTLSCVPYGGSDPFVLERCDVLVAGGCRRACSRIYRGCAVVGVPDFDATGAAVLLSLGDGSVEELVCPDIYSSAT